MKTNSKVLLAVGVSILMALPFVASLYFATPQKLPVTIDHPLLGKGMFEPHGYDAVKLYFEENPQSRIDIKELLWDPVSTDSVTFFRTALQRETEFFITSMSSSMLTQSAHLFQDPGVLLLNLAATSSTLSEKDDFILRLISDTAHEQEAIGHFVNTLPGGRLLVLQDAANPGYTDTAYLYFMKELDKSGRWKVDHEKFIFKDFNPSALGAQMKQPYDALYILGGNFQLNMGNIIQLFSKEHPNAPIILTPWARSNSVYQLAGPAVKNIIILSHYPAWDKAPDAAAYLARFQKRFGYQPLPIALALQQALELLEQAFAAGHETPESVKAFLLSQKELTTTVGKISFDKFGDAKQPLHPVFGHER